MIAAQAELIKRLGYKFRNTELVERALTHRSLGTKNYERLEFLGDSVLEFTISAYLYEQFPDLSEGELTRLRASLVRKESLAQLARQLELGRYIRLGGGESKSGGHDRDSILADAMEALFGAVYTDGGFEAASRVVLTLYQSLLQAVDPAAIQKDPKTRLQELLQKHAQPIPEYEVVKVSGKAHAQHFRVSCRVDGLEQAVEGEGRSRRAAEQDAATKALYKLAEAT
ncbi:MAG: ribonuclease III [Acidiferrobacterales bacterium]